MNPGIIQLSRPFAVMPRGLLGYQTPVPTTYPLAASDGNITNGLVAWWKLDETKGVVASDSSGNGLNGTLNGGFQFSYSPGIVGNSLANMLGTTGGGATRYISVPNNALLNFANDFTMCGWCNNRSEGFAFKKNDSNTLGQYNFSIRSPGYNGIYFRTGSISDVYPTTDQYPLLIDGYWHHVCATRSVNIVSIYIDGIKLKVTGNPAYYSFAANTVPLQLLGNGSADDLRMYNRALSDSEVKALYEYRSPKYWEP